MEAIPALFVVGVVVWLAVASNKQAERRRRLLASLGAQLAGGHDERSAWGELANTRVRMSLVTRGGGKQAQAWTEIDADIPARYPLALFVYKHGWNDDAKIARGEMVDVTVGDERFDRAFVVEAAPADVARVLLDERARQYLLALADKYHFTITTEGRGTDRVQLRFALRSWLDDAAEVMLAIETVAAIAGRVRDAYVAVEQAIAPAETGSPYRPVLDDRRAREAADARLAEVATVEKVRTARAAKQQLIGIGLLVALVFVWIAMLAAAN